MIGWLMNMEQLVEWELAGETEVLRENLSQHYFVHHKSHSTCLFTSYILYYCLDIHYDTLQKATCVGNINPLCKLL
jgi:hypothetical protein